MSSNIYLTSEAAALGAEIGTMIFPGAGSIVGTIIGVAMGTAVSYGLDYLIDPYLQDAKRRAS